MRLHNQSRRSSGIGMFTDCAAARQVLETFPRRITDSETAEKYMSVAKPIYGAYPAIRLAVPISEGADSDLYLSLLPTYLLMAPHFLSFSEKISRMAYFIAKVMGINVMQPVFRKNSDSESDSESDSDEDESEDVSAYRTIDGETLLSVAIECGSIEPVVMLIKDYPQLLGMFDGDRTSALQHLLSVPKSANMVRAIANALEACQPTKVLTRLFAHDYLLDGSKGIELLRDNKYDVKPILRLIDGVFLKSIALEFGLDTEHITPISQELLL